MDRFGIGQNFNPHTLRTIINSTNKDKTKWYDEEKSKKPNKKEKIKDVDNER